jgi:hypothetical protein
MTNQKIVPVFFASLFLFFSCANSPNASTDLETASVVPATKNIAQASPERVVLKTAELKLQVDNVPQKVKEIQSVISTMQGHVIHYEINTNKFFKKELEYSLDSSYVINECKPEGLLKVKIPISQCDTFIQTMLSMNTDIDKLLIDEEDVTEDLIEKKELISTGAIKGIEENSLKKEKYYDDKNETTIRRKAEYSKLNYRAKYLWFDIYLQGNSYLEKNKIASSKIMYTPFYVKALKAINEGWQGFSLLLTLLLRIWPFILIVIIILLIYKRKWWRLKRITN